MVRQRPQLAKLSRPRLHAPVSRDRLFRILDGLRSSPVIWIEGPPGAGKTTTVCTYLDAAQVSGMWYQLDAGDSDAATFFHYLREAAGRHRSAKLRLPVFAANHLTDLPGFARRFFRILFQRLPPATIIVFDNYQELADDSPVHGILACAAEEVPEGANIFVLSRAEPPRALARAKLNKTIAMLDWDVLRLSIDEIRSIAGAHSAVTEGMLEALHRESQGWAAGVVLMLERLPHAGAISREQRFNGREATFDYFASQIFDSASPETREVLMQTALSPMVTVALAVAVTGNPLAGIVLEHLYKRRLFIDRRAGPQNVYQYHALFRAFLCHQATMEYSEQQRKTLLDRIARVLLADGETESAFALYCEANDWVQASRVLRIIAPTLIGQGRLQTVADCAGAFPEPIRNLDPDVTYWLGIALAPSRPDEARLCLQRAYELYKARDDHAGELLSTAGIIDALFIDYSDFTSMRAWSELLTQALEAGPVFGSIEDELRVRLSLLSTVHNVPDNRLLAECAARVERLLTNPVDVNLKVVAGTRLLSYGDAISDTELCRRVAHVILPLLNLAQLAPANAALFLSNWGYHLYIAWCMDQALQCFDRVNAISEREGFHDERFRATAYRGLCLRRANQLPLAEATLKELATLPKPRDGARASMAEMLKALMAYSRGDLAQAVDVGLRAQQVVDASMNIFNAVVYRVLNADMLMTIGQLDEASTKLHEARSLATGTALDRLRSYIALNQAHLAHIRGDGVARAEYMREALSLAHVEGARARLRWYPRAMETLFPIALREGIEPQIVRSLIRSCSLTPPSPAIEEWPWPVKIYTLGEFEMWRDGQRVTFDRKAPRKTLALLKALIAFGAHEIAEDKLVEALWPDDDGDAAHRSLAQALHRLRKILGDNAVIRQLAGKLSLDLRRCWVDALAFRHLLGSASGSEDDTQTAVALYRGPFLQAEESHGWIVSARERLRADFVGAVGELATRKERSDDFTGAIEVYRRGLAADELVEPFYQGLMRCYRRLDRRSEALGTYRRLRQTLSVVLGIAPSATTEKLYREL